MAKRFADTEIWDKEWFMRLSCKHKCLVKYLFDKCDVAGIWTPNWTLASTQINETVSELDLVCFKHQTEKLPNGKIFIPDFIKFQYGKLSEKCKPHEKVIDILKKYNLFERVSQRVSDTLNSTLQEKDKDMEEEEDMEMEKEKDFGKSENLLCPQMVKIFKETFPNYPINRESDYSNCLLIAYQIADANKWERKSVVNGKMDETVKFWSQIVQWGKGDSWFSGRSISDYNKEWQRLIQKINSSNGTTKSNNGFSREGIQAAVNERIKNRQQT